MPWFFQVPSAPKEGYGTSLICSGGLAPRPSTPVLNLAGLLINQARWGRKLHPVDTGWEYETQLRSSPSPFWRASSVGKLHSPPHCAAILEPFSGHGQENNLVLTTISFTFCSVVQFVPSFIPSFIQPTSLLCLCWVQETRTRMGPVPCLQCAPSWHIPAALPFPAPQAQTQVRPPGKVL